MSVTAETTRHTNTSARCTARDCLWLRSVVLTTYDGRKVRGDARAHAERTGHTVQVEVETHSGTFLSRGGG